MATLAVKTVLNTMNTVTWREGESTKENNDTTISDHDIKWKIVMFKNDFSLVL